MSSVLPTIREYRRRALPIMRRGLALLNLPRYEHTQGKLRRLLITSQVIRCRTTL